MTLKQALKLFKSEIMPNYKQESITTVRCAFNEWTDQLHKNREITDRQRFIWTYK